MSGERWVIKMCLATGDPPEYLACGNKKWAADSKQDLVINKTSTLSLTSPSSSLSTSYPACQRFIFLHLHFCEDDELVAECGPGCDPRHKEMSANLMNLVKSLRILCRLNAHKRTVNFRETSSKIVVIDWNMRENNLPKTGANAKQILFRPQNLCGEQSADCWWWDCWTITGLSECIEFRVQLWTSHPGWSITHCSALSVSWESFWKASWLWRMTDSELSKHQVIILSQLPNTESHRPVFLRNQTPSQINWTYKCGRSRIILGTIGVFQYAERVNSCDKFGPGHSDHNSGAQWPVTNASVPDTVSPTKYFSVSRFQD